MTSALPDVTAIRGALNLRAMLCTRFFEREALPLAYASREMAARFNRGGRLFAFGCGAYAAAAGRLCADFALATGAGRGPLPTLDVSAAPPASAGALCGPVDIAMAFAPPSGEDAALEMLRAARARGAMTIAWPGRDTSYAVTAPAADELIHQELFTLLACAMYQAVRAFLHRSGAGPSTEGGDVLVDRVAASIGAHAAAANTLRERIAAEGAESIALAAGAMRERFARGGRIVAVEDVRSTGDDVALVRCGAVPDHLAEAFADARGRGVLTIALSGSADHLLHLADLAIQVPGGDPLQLAQAQSLAYHLLLEVARPSRIGFPT